MESACIPDCTHVELDQVLKFVQRHSRQFGYEYLLNPDLERATQAISDGCQAVLDRALNTCR